MGRRKPEAEQDDTEAPHVSWQDPAKPKTYTATSQMPRRRFQKPKAFGAVFAYEDDDLEAWDEDEGEDEYEGYIEDLDDNSDDDEVDQNEAVGSRCVCRDCALDSDWVREDYSDEVSAKELDDDRAADNSDLDGSTLEDDLEDESEDAAESSEYASEESDEDDSDVISVYSEESDEGADEDESEVISVYSESDDEDLADSDDWGQSDEDGSEDNYDVLRGEHEESVEEESDEEVEGSGSDEDGSEDNYDVLGGENGESDEDYSEVSYIYSEESESYDLEDAEEFSEDEHEESEEDEPESYEDPTGSAGRRSRFQQSQHSSRHAGGTYRGHQEALYAEPIEKLPKHLLKGELEKYRPNKAVIVSGIATGGTLGLLATGREVYVTGAMGAATFGLALLGSNCNTRDFLLYAGGSATLTSIAKGAFEYLQKRKQQHKTEVCEQLP